MRPAITQRLATHRIVPGADSTAAAIGNTGIEVVSSPYLVGLLEEASHRAVRDLYELGEATVGTRIDVSHLAAAFPGREIQAQARLELVDGRRLRFLVSAYQDGREIMRGTHERVVVQIDRFLQSSKNEAKSPPSVTSGRPIEFFFDYHSPWCYFASLRIDQIAARVGREVVWKPMHLARLIERIDGRRPLDANAAFVRFFKADLHDWAAQLGVDLRYHPNFPLRPVRALRATAYAIQQGRVEPFVVGIMRAYWTESRDISDLDQLAQIGIAAGLDEQGVRASIEDPAFKATVEENTTQAQARGVFGAPSFFCDDKLFWGNDRLGQLEDYAQALRDHP
jgi:2-hydroxychromene-2-carboxylate isomerase/predicted thioesterase